MARTIDYVYNPLNRLTEANYDDETYFHYVYDPVGNRLTEETQIGATSYAYDPANRLTDVAGQAYTWDANGNLLSDGTSSYTYDKANRLVAVSQSGVNHAYAYNGAGDRLSQTVDGVTTNYTLDLAGGLTQVLSDGTNAYLYGLGRVGEQGAEWQYHLGDALGSVRQLVGANGAVSFAQSYAPYGSVLSSGGGAATTYGFAGEWTDGTGLVHLRARYLATGVGRFTSRDVWDGEYTRPLSLNRWGYVEGNPVRYTDPSGFVLDPADPTQRGTIIHMMIQQQYFSEYSPRVGIEVSIPSGSVRGLHKIDTQWGTVYGIDDPSWYVGRADIIDYDENGLYETKPYNAKEIGVATVALYLYAWNTAVARGDGSVQGTYLNPGSKYERLPGRIVGTDPLDNSKWIKAGLYDPGVILYWAVSKNDGDTIPVFIYEWDPSELRVRQRRSADALATAYAYSYEQSREIQASMNDAALLAICTYLLIKLAEAAACGPCALVPVP